MAEGEAREQEAAQDEQGGSNGSNAAGLSRLMSKDVLIPVATAATAAAAGFAVKKAPDLKNLIAGEAKEGAEELGREGAQGAKQEIVGGGGPLGSIAGGLQKLKPGGHGGPKKTRRLPIQRWTDVAVPVDEAYERWTQFDEFPKFMHRVQKVEQQDDGTVEWEEKIWFSRRQWKGEVTEQRKNDRVAWKTVSGTSHSGIVSFHRLDDRLTRVLVTVDFQPEGMLEKMASGLRFVKRAVQADLARFKAYVELGQAEGLEYQVAPERGDDENEDEHKNENEDRAENKGRKSQGSNGGRESGDDEREAEREEREQRRQERREALSSSG